MRKSSTKRSPFNRRIRTPSRVPAEFAVYRRRIFQEPPATRHHSLTVKNDLIIHQPSPKLCNEKTFFPTCLEFVKSPFAWYCFASARLVSFLHFFGMLTFLEGEEQRADEQEERRASQHHHQRKPSPFRVPTVTQRQV